MLATNCKGTDPELIPTIPIFMQSADRQFKS